MPGNYIIRRTRITTTGPIWEWRTANGWTATKSSALKIKLHRVVSDARRFWRTNTDPTVIRVDYFYDS